MRYHPRVLAAAQQRVLRRLGPVLTPWRFYLGGGTALAIRLGHRRSMDLGWFTEDALPDPLRLAQEIRDHGIPLVTRQVDRGTLYSSISRVRFSLLEYRHPALQAADYGGRSAAPWRRCPTSPPLSCRPSHSAGRKRISSTMRSAGRGSP